jgi:multiple sugar transport system substrate-binding protein
MSWHKTSLAVALVSGLAGLALTGTARAEDKSLTLCWAAWDPANALVELGKDFTKQTGFR